MFSGYAIGGMTSALLGAWLVKDMGWQIMFLIAGIPCCCSRSFGSFTRVSRLLVKSNHSEQAKVL